MRKNVSIGPPGQCILNASVHNTVCRVHAGELCEISHGLQFGPRGLNQKNSR